MDAGAARAKVPVATVVVAAWRAVFARPGLVLEFGWLPLLAMLAALLLPPLALRYALAANLARSLAPDINVAGVILDGTVTLIALNTFALRWHRLMLTGDLHPWPLRPFLRAWLRFMLYTLAIVVIGWAAILAAWYAGVITPDGSAAAAGGSLAAGIVALALLLGVTRLSLVLPAAALGDPLGLGAAWRAMRGNTWRLLLANVVSALPVVLATGLILGQLLAAAHLAAGEVVAPDPPIGLVLLTSVIEVVLRVVLVALGASILSGFYRRVVLQRKESER
jgi:hypothetical protein